MLGSKKSGMGVSGGTTLISRDTVIVGEVHFSGNLDVEGLVQGNIVAKPEKDACVRVVDRGRVEGDIYAPAVVINGSVEGDVHSSQHLELASKARVQVNGSLQHVAATAEVAPAKPLELGVDVRGVSEIAALRQAGGDPKKS